MLLCFLGMGESIPDCSLSDLVTVQHQPPDRRTLVWRQSGNLCDSGTYITRLRVLRANMAHLKSEFERGSSVGPFEVNIADWPWFGRGTTLFEVLLLPGLEQELLLLWADIWA
jgi:hypothetical protein